MAQALFDQAAEHGDELESVYARVYPYVGGRGVALMLAGMLLAMAGSLYRGSLPVVIMRRDRPGHLGRLSHWLIRLTSFVAILVGMLVYLELDAPDLGGDRHWFYLNALVGFAALVVSMVLHELGHAAVARLVGFKVFLVIIGIGPRLFEGHAGATRVIVNAFPTFGLTTVATRRPERFRSRYSLVVLAGPATNLGLAALCYVWLGGDVSLASFFQGLAPVTAALFANLLLFVTNVIPFGSFATDGYQLVRIPGLTPAERLEHEASYFAHEGFEILLAGDIEGAESRFRAGLERYPESLILNLNLGVGLVSGGAHGEAHAIFAELDERDDALSQSMMPLIANNLAYCEVLDGKPEQLAAAELNCERALTAAPRMPAFLATHGCLLLRRGELKRGLALLRRGFHGSPDRLSKAMNAGWLAIGEGLAGNPAKAKRWLERARKLYPRAPFLDVVGRELDNAALGEDRD